MTTFSIWTRDGLNGWNKGAALYANRNDAAAVAVSSVGKVVYHGGGFHGVCTSVRVFPSSLSRKDVEDRIALTN